MWTQLKLPFILKILSLILFSFVVCNTSIWEPNGYRKMKIVCTRVAVNKSSNDDDGRCRKGGADSTIPYIVSPLRYQKWSDKLYEERVTQTGESASLNYGT